MKQKHNPEMKKREGLSPIREAALDKTLADSFPTSDPPSTIPDPEDQSTPGADRPPDQGPNPRP